MDVKQGRNAIVRSIRMLGAILAAIKEVEKMMDNMDDGPEKDGVIKCLTIFKNHLALANAEEQ